MLFACIKSELSLDEWQEMMSIFSLICLCSSKHNKVKHWSFLGMIQDP